MSPSRLQAWLAKTPGNAVRLEVRWDTVGGEQVIAQWTSQELERDACAQILQAVQDHCDDLEQRARYECAWLDENDRVLRTKAIRCEPESEEEDEEAGAINPFVGVRKEDASAAGLVAQLMRHMEVRERMYHSGMASVLRASMDTLRDQRAENSELRGENKLLRQRLRIAGEKTEDTSQVDEAVATESLARAAAWDKFADAVTQQVIPVLLTHVRPTH